MEFKKTKIVEVRDTRYNAKNLIANERKSNLLIHIYFE